MAASAPCLPPLHLNSMGTDGMSEYSGCMGVMEGRQVTWRRAEHPAKQEPPIRFGAFGQQTDCGPAWMRCRKMPVGIRRCGEAGARSAALRTPSSGTAEPRNSCRNFGDAQFDAPPAKARLRRARSPECGYKSNRASRTFPSAGGFQGADEPVGVRRRDELEDVPPAAQGTNAPWESP